MTRRVRWIRHWKLVALLAAVLAAIVAAFGGSRVGALTSSERSSAAPSDRELDVRGPVGIFTGTVVHDLAVTFDRAAYDRMIETYKSDGRKVYIPATLTIDGTRVPQVGLRLKGNSTLRGLRGGGGFGGPGGALSAAEPERLPWLISFDEFVAGRTYQGYETLAVRAGGKGGMAGESGLNEAIALRLIGRAGQPAERSAFAKLTVNGRPGVLRLLVEDPDTPFADSQFEHDGVLYKALSTGSFAYLGDDPLAYGEAFKQITRKKQQDLEPLIKLLRWTNRASDSEFAAGLPERVDIEAFAAYVALQNITDNFDDMAGPGQNYYLWYDLDSGRFTPVTWDMNLAWSAFAGRSPGGARLGGARPGGFGENGGNGDAPPFGGDDDDGGVGFGARGGNLLKERFLVTAPYAEIVAATEAKLRAMLLGEPALSELSRLRTVAASSNAIDKAALTAEVESLRQRLAGDETESTRPG
jgi:spore coat protein CotH